MRRGKKSSEVLLCKIIFCVNSSAKRNNTPPNGKISNLRFALGHKLLTKTCDFLGKCMVFSKRESKQPDNVSIRKIPMHLVKFSLGQRLRVKSHGPCFSRKQIPMFTLT